MLTALLIPADPNEPVSTTHLEVNDHDAFRALVGGDLWRITLGRPNATLYFDTDAKAKDKPANMRATMLMWLHNRIFANNDVAAGDCFILGPPDAAGSETTAPDDLVQLFLHTARCKAQVKVTGQYGWVDNGNTYDNWYDAYTQAVAVAQRWTLVEDARVIPDRTEELEQLMPTWLRAGNENLWISEATDPPFTRDCFYVCYTAEELQEKLTSTIWCVGTAFVYRDLCLINQIEGDEWLAIRHGIAFESITFRPIIERGEFQNYIARLLAATKEQCQRLEY